MSCNSDCSSCKTKSGCSSQSMKVVANEKSNIKKVIAIISGKGGVGKSLSTSAIAVAMQKKGKQTAIIDGDLTGACIPNIFGLSDQLLSDGENIIPAETTTGIKAISVNLMLETPETPIIWRGAVLSNMLKQFFTDCVWGNVDFMFIDMPPGTGDLPLTAYQSLPIDGIIIVTTPQDMVSMIVSKAYNMAKAMDIPVIGIIENFSYMECDKCGHAIYPFGKGKAEELALKFNTQVLGKMPIDLNLSNACDLGIIEAINLPQYNLIADKIDEYFKGQN